MSHRAFGLFLLVCSIAVPARGMAPLREIGTRHYLIHTDLDDALARDLGGRMDAMYGEYAQRLAVFKAGANPAPRLQAYLFQHARDYNEFTRGRLANSGGVFLPGQNALAAFLEGQGRDQLRRTLQHEAFHQFAFNAISTDLPIWLNEGLAQFFEEGLWNGDGFLLGEVPPRRVRQLQLDLNGARLVDFFTLLPMTNEQWARRLVGSREDGATQYNQSWAMVHFLVMAQNVRGEFLYRSRLLDLLRYLHQGKTAGQAFQIAFGGNVVGFRDRFMEYSRALRPTPEATLIENQGVLADLLINFEREGKTFDDVAAFRTHVVRGRYKMHYFRGELQWDTDPNMNRYFSDLGGRLFDPQELFFSVRTGAPLPDVVCRCTDTLVLRTRFVDGGDNRIDHELLIEPLRASASISR